MDIVLSQVSELRKLWDLIGYQGNRNESEIFQSFSQWQHERLKVRDAAECASFMYNYRSLERY